MKKDQEALESWKIENHESHDTVKIFKFYNPPKDNLKMFSTLEILYSVQCAPSKPSDSENLGSPDFIKW